MSKKELWIMSILSFLIICVILTFSVIIYSMVQDNPIKVTSNTDIDDTEIKNINRDDGLTDKEFWTLYNYWNEKDGYGFPKVNVEEYASMRRGSVDVGKGVYFIYQSNTKDNFSSTIFVRGDEVQNYDPKQYANLFKLIVQITEGEESYLFLNLYEMTKHILGGNFTVGKYYSWKYTETEFDISIMGKPKSETLRELQNNQSRNINDNHISSDNQIIDIENDNVIGSQDNYYGYSEDYMNARRELVYAVLGRDFIFNPDTDTEYDITNWSNERVRALMEAESLYYEERGLPSPFD